MTQTPKAFSNMIPGGISLKAILSAEEQHARMTRTPIPKLVLTLAVPTVVSMMITAIYNTADTYFVSQISTSASGAVGVVFSLMAVIQAVGFTLGMGAGSLCSRRLGAKDNKAADVYASTAFFTALAIGVLIAILGTALLDRLMLLLGATPTILPHAAAYGRYIILGAPVMAASFVLNNLLRAEGKASFAMIGLGAGGLLNIALDPLFIFTFGLGTAGAAIATLISQCVSFVLLLYMFLSGKSVLHLTPRLIARTWKPYGEILTVGMPSLFRQGFASVAAVLLNRAAGVYGDAAVAAMSINSRIFMFILSMILGIGQGFMPVVGYNYGAKLYGRVRAAYRFTVLMGFSVMIVLGAAGFFFAPQVVALFRADDPDVIRIGTVAMRLQCAVMPLQALLVGTNMLLQSVGWSVSAMYLSINRQGVFFLPLILLLPALYGLLGVQLAQPVADVLSTLACVPFIFVFFRKLPHKS